MAESKQGESLADDGAAIDTSALAAQTGGDGEPEKDAAETVVHEPDAAVEPEATVTRLDQHPRFKEVIQQKNTYKTQAEQEREARIRAEAERDALRAQTYTPQPQGPQRRWTTEELEQGFNEGKVTREFVESYKDETRRIEVRQEIARAIEERELAAEIKRATGRYHDLAPGWDDGRSENFQKAKREYDRLVRQRLPPTEATQLTALELAFGKADTLETARRSEDLTASSRATHRESSTAQRGNGTGNGGDPNDPYSQVAKMVSKEELTIYADGIRRGNWDNWAAVLDEVKSAATSPYNEPLRAAHRR